MGEGRTIPTCSRIVRTALGGALLVAGSAAAASIEERSPAAAYVFARAASKAGAADQASSGFAAALAAAPESELVASQALSHAVVAGDWPLALHAVRTLEQGQALLPDGRFVLLAEALRREDWAEAGRQVNAIEQEGLFAFVLPVVRAWIAHAGGAGDPIAILDAAAAEKASAPFVAEQRPLLLIAMGRPEDVRSLIEDAGLGARALRLRIAAAATLAGRGDREGALALLQGEDRPFVAARELVESGKAIPGAIDDPASAAAELFVALSFGLQREDFGSLALSFARLATWLAPDSSEAWIVASELLSAEEEHAAAIALTEMVAADDPFAAMARDQRIRILASSGDLEGATAEAEAAARESAAMADWVRLGEFYQQAGRHGDAAGAFGRALAVAEGAGSLWPLWLMRGDAWYQAGDWPNAHAALREAHRLAPGEPVVLNYLGYALLERGQAMAEAEEMIREAHRLAPESAPIADSLGWALHLRGQSAEAVGLLEKAAQGEPADVEINEHLGDAYFALGRRIEARYAWKAALVYAEGEDAARLREKIAGGIDPRLAGR